MSISVLNWFCGIAADSGIAWATLAGSGIDIEAA
jgi:hypothetical protein